MKYEQGVQTHILKTPSVIVDSLLGQGEALDCYNQLLQDHAVTIADLQNKDLDRAIKQSNTSFEIENRLKELAIGIIEQISDPIQKAEMYKKVIGDCCDVPQSGFCCGNCNQTVNE